MTHLIKIHWKKNLRKIPDWILAKVNSFKKDDFVVACVKKIPTSDIAKGKYNHLNIKLDGEKPAFSKNVVPKAEVGKFSKINVEGQEIVRKDLPMVSKAFTWETPNYGDWSLGSHDITIYRDVYQRDFLPPKEIAVTIELLAEEIGPEKLYIFKFCVDEDLNRNHEYLEESLFFNLNLLQENVGAIDVFETDAKLSDYLTTIYVNWEILPPGERDENIDRILSGFRAPTEEIRQKLTERYKLLESFKPIEFIAGTSGFRRYFGAKFSESLVVFENLEYGNAIYIMFEDWESLSKMSRLELLSSQREGFERIIHISGWESKLKKLLREKKKKH